MIQDIAPHHFHNEYTPRPAKPEDVVFLFRGNEILAGQDPEGNLSFPKVREAEGPMQYLFCVDETAFYLGTGEIPGYEYRNLRCLRSGKPAQLCFAGVTAWHLYHWYTHHRYCGVCGSPVIHHEKLRALKCPNCGNEIFPVIAPAVIVAVTRGDEILVTRYAGREHKGIALIAGFCEIGERAEDTVHREVMEEAGIQVKNLQYFDSQPWGFASNLLMGYFAELDGNPEIHMDTEELQEARWVKREDLPEPENLASLTATMLESFRQGRSGEEPGLALSGRM